MLGLLFVAALMPGAARIKADFTYRAFFHEDDPMLIRFDRFERQFGNDDAIILAIESPSGIFDQESAELLIKVTDAMWKVPEVIRVDSLSNFNWVHATEDELIIEPLLPDDQALTPELLAERKAVALKHETLPGYLISKDTKTTLMFAFIKPGIDAAPDSKNITNAMRALIKEHETGDHRFFLTGGPPLNYAFEEAATQDMTRLMPIVWGVTLLLLILTIRRAVGIALALMVVTLSIMTSLAFSGWLGHPLTNVTMTLPQILIAIGIADSVHILVSFYRAMSRGSDRQRAAQYTLTKNFVPTLLTSLTTAVGFFSFSTAEVRPIASLGVLAGTGAIFAWIITYLILGALITLIPQKPKLLPEDRIVGRDASVERFTRRLQDYRLPIIGGFLLLTFAAVGASTQNTVNSDPFKYFSEEFPIRIANEFIDAQIGGSRGVELIVTAGEPEGVMDPALLSKVEELQTWIESQPLVTRTLSIVDVLKQTNRSLNGDKQEFYKLPSSREEAGQEFFLYTMGLPQGMDLNDQVSLKKDAMRVRVLWTIPTSAETVDMVDKIVAKGEALGLDVLPSGKNLLWQSMVGYVVNSFLVSVSVAVVMISLLLIVFFRSFKLGMLAMIPNTIPLIFGGAALFLIGQPLDIGTVLVSSVCLGIAVDDTIHVLANYGRLRRNGRSPREAIQEVLTHSAPALVVTTLILVTSFGTFVLATFSPNLFFGLMTAIILSAALITDLTLLPAILLRGQDEA